MRRKSVLPLVGLILVLGVQHVISESPLPKGDHGECGFSSDDKDLCALYCYRSMKLGLAYIIELKEKIKILEENHSERENSQLSKAVENLQSKIDQQNIQIANINDFITNSVRQKEMDEKAKSQTEMDNFKRQVEQLKENLENVQRQAAKDKEESLAEQKYLRNKIEQILRDKNTEIDRARNREIENLKEKLASQKSDLDKAIKDLESKNKEFEEYQTKEKNSSNKIGELHSEISSLKKSLEESETQLTDSNHLLERKLNQTAEDLVECQKRIPKTGCKGLSSGIHTIEIAGLDPISALCEGDIEGGGWIVIHKRFDGSVDFNRTWTEYRNGFGDKKGEFFIGLENLHRITNSQTYELYVQVKYHSKPSEFASYNNFTIGNETTKYKLESVGEFKGTAYNSMEYNLNAPFSSFDQDSDQRKDDNCAQWHGGWWHKANSTQNTSIEKSMIVQV
ncbi:angiopoietin-related protein 7-like isoform X2 [Drosophila willistoni]|uniref:angiopoietin-related protein 7-like isoform X2 n=1 Tax=Drosophila willistoni TaxID=7260 RepID=UPI001F07DF61|nr:angiopoietin-related protein 7-like isoform X2 [Drosophila willistoni]